MYAFAFDPLFVLFTRIPFICNYHSLIRYQSLQGMQIQNIPWINKCFGDNSLPHIYRYLPAIAKPKFILAFAGIAGVFIGCVLSNYGIVQPFLPVLDRLVSFFP